MSRPAWASEYPTYESMVGSWGYEVAAFETFGSCQGDHLALVESDGKVGLVVIGYGSCSGCDALESATPWPDDDDEGDWSAVASLSDDLKSAIHWEDSRDGLRDWIDAHPENHWWSYEDEIAAWLNERLGTHLRTE